MKIPGKLLNRYSPFWHSVRATPLLIPFAGVVMMLLSPSVMVGGFTIGALVSNPLNTLLKMLFKWLHYQINGSYKGTTFLGQGMRPVGAKGSGVFLQFPLTKSTTWGMPSGHSQLAWYVVGFLIGYLFIWRPYQFTTTHKIVATVVTILAALVISFSRIWVDGAHTLSQVVAGGIIGIVLGLVTLLVTRVIAAKYWNEQFANEVDVMADNENAAEIAQNAAKESEIAAQSVEIAKNSANEGNMDKLKPSNEKPTTKLPTKPASKETSTKPASKPTSTKPASKPTSTKPASKDEK